MSKEEARAILEFTLGSLLGFDDGASDVLDHLLTIESRQDLLEYLSQLLGDATPEILDFVDNVGLYHRGEPLTLAKPANKKQGNEANSKRPPAAKPAEAAPTSKANQTSKKDALQARRKNHNQNNKSRVPRPKTMNPPPSAENNSTQSKTPESTQQSTPPKEEPSEEEEPTRTVEKSRPGRGKAKTVCGCFGTKHKALTNCLYCGRISCVEEGYDYCAFCGLMVEEVVKDGIHDNDGAWVQKERLLRFDREFARRTEILDDQADHQGPSNWMTEEEREQAEENQQRQLESLKHPKQTLKLDIL